MATIEKVATFSPPGHVDSPVELKSRYDNFIGGHWVVPVKEQYSENVTPATGEPFTEVPRSTPEDLDLALDAAHERWGSPSFVLDVGSGAGSGFSLEGLDDVHFRVVGSQVAY